MEITPPLHALNALPAREGSVSHSQQGQDFTDLLKQAVGSVNDLQQEADSAARDFVIGDAGNIHGTILSLEKADLSLRLLNQMRNKVVEAYHEMMRMQI